jgi:hypothetical protein
MLALDFIIELLLEILVELVAEIIFALGWESTREAFRDRPKAHPALAALGYALFGAMLGALSAWIFPVRLSQNDAVTTLSVILNPMAAGFAMQQYGAFRVRRNKSTTNLATFLGGFAFAAGVSATRFLLVVVA